MRIPYNVYKSDIEPHFEALYDIAKQYDAPLIISMAADPASTDLVSTLFVPPGSGSKMEAAAEILDDNPHVALSILLATFVEAGKRP